MRILVVENYPGTTVGLVGEVLLAEGATLNVVRAHAEEPLPESHEGHDGLIVLGGAQSALDDADYPYLPRLCELTRAFGDSGRPVLGICLGLQIVARTYGGENILGRPLEFGYRAVRATPEGADDPVLKPLAPQAALFQWHGDTVGLPPDAVQLATNDHTDVQAFRIGRNVYATQFHFEASREIVRRWSDDFAGLIAQDVPDWGERAEAEIAGKGAAADAVGAALTKGWMRLM